MSAIFFSPQTTKRNIFFYFLTLCFIIKSRKFWKIVKLFSLWIKPEVFMTFRQIYSMTSVGLHPGGNIFFFFGTFSLNFNNTQKQCIWLPRSWTHFWTRLGIDTIRWTISSCVVSIRAIWTSWIKCAKFCGGWLSLLRTVSHTCSMGFKSNQLAGHGVKDCLQFDEQYGDVHCLVENCSFSKSNLTKRRYRV